MKKILVALLLVNLALPGLVVAAECSVGPCPPTGSCPKDTHCKQGQCVYDNKLNLCYPQFPGAPLLKLGLGLDSLVAWLYTLIVGISGLAAFVMIVWGGVQWMSSQGNPTATGDAKDKIQKALLGLLLVLASFLILQIINPELTLLK